jgi:hypothetical protein
MARDGIVATSQRVAGRIDSSPAIPPSKTRPPIDFFLILNQANAAVALHFWRFSRDGHVQTHEVLVS